MTRWIVATLVGCACARGDARVDPAGASSTSGAVDSTTDEHEGDTSGNVGDDGFAMAYSPVTRTFAAVFHGQSDEDFAAAFDADGMQSAAIEATASRGRDGHFNPHVTAHSTRPEWLLVTSLGFATIVGQRLGP